MHGTQMLNRKGRKRKSGARSKSGSLVRATVDYLTLAANNPDRRDLPADKRLSEKAASLLGKFNLLSKISDAQYEAGRRYAVIVGAYLAMANAPRSTAGASRGPGCAGELKCPPDTCACLAKTDRYTDAYEAVETAGRISIFGAHKVHIAVKRVAIHDQACFPDQVEPLKLGLSALASHFGLTNHRK